MLTGEHKLQMINFSWLLERYQNDADEFPGQNVRVNGDETWLQFVCWI
jgi:hypothetical protein